MNEDNKNPLDKDEAGQSALQAISKDYQVIGKKHVRGWYAWGAIGITVGIIIGVMFVANRSAQFNASLATAPDSPTLNHFDFDYSPQGFENYRPDFSGISQRFIPLEYRPIEPHSTGEIRYETELDGRSITVNFPNQESYDALLAAGSYMLPLEDVKLILYKNPQEGLLPLQGSVLEAWNQEIPQFLCDEEVLRGIGATGPENQLIAVSFNWDGPSVAQFTATDSQSSQYTAQGDAALYQKTVITDPKIIAFLEQYAVLVPAAKSNLLFNLGDCPRISGTCKLPTNRCTGVTVFKHRVTGEWIRDEYPLDCKNGDQTVESQLEGWAWEALNFFSAGNMKRSGKPPESFLCLCDI